MLFILALKNKLRKTHPVESQGEAMNDFINIVFRIVMESLSNKKKANKWDKALERKRHSYDFMNMIDNKR